MANAFSFNLQRARQVRNLSMDDLAKLVGCSKQSISHYESGKRFPDGETLRAIANALDYDKETLLKENNLQFSVLDVNYRQGGDLSFREKSEIEKEASKYLNTYIELEQIAKENISFKNPISDILIRNSSDAEKAAKQVRKRWNLGEFPIPNVAKLLEDRGIKVLKINFGPIYQHEGLSGWAENKTIPVIAINQQQKEITRVRHTLLHELAHLILCIESSLDYESIEKICEVFAGTLLLPTDILEREIGKNRTTVSMPELRRIKENYGISVLSIMLRASFAKIIPFEVYSKWKNSKFSSDDYGKYLGREEPERFNNLLIRCLSEQKIGIDKAARMAGKNTADFYKLYDNLIKF